MRNPFNLTLRFAIALAVLPACGEQVVDQPTELLSDEEPNALPKDAVVLEFDWSSADVEAPMLSDESGIFTTRSYRGEAELTVDVPVAGEWRLSFLAQNPTNGKSAFRLSTTETRYKNSNPRESSFGRQVRLSKKDLADGDFSRTAVLLHLAAGS